MIDESQELKIWAAGLFDGEGSALIERVGTQRKNLQVVVAIASSDPRITDPIRETWGGHYRKNRDFTKYYKDGHRRKLDCTVYFTYGEARVLLKDILPYLRMKKDEALVVFKALCALPEHVTGPDGKPKRLKGATPILRPFYLQLQELRGSSVK